MTGEVPEWITKKGIDSAGYGALKFLLDGDTSTIYQHKFMWSNLAGRDIGTPETVRRIVLSASIDERIHHLLTPQSSSYWGSDLDRKTVREGCKGVDLRQFVKLATAGYLLGTNFSRPYSHPDSFIPQTACTRTFRDNDGNDQLEGELRRYWAQKNNIPNPGSIAVDRLIIRHYCDMHGLREFEPAFTASIAWRPLPE